MHHLPTGMSYNYPEMADPFELYHQELVKSDRDPKTIARYWQVIKSYQNWLGARLPDVASAKDFIAHLRDAGYQPRSILLYYHALRLFFEFIGMPLKMKLRKPKILPPYHDTGDIEALVRQAELGLRCQKRKQKERNKALVLIQAFAGLRIGEALNTVVGDLDFNNYNLRVRQGKGKKDRTVPMAQRLVVPLRQLTAGKGAQDKVFTNLNARSAYRVITRLAKAAGLDGLHPHSLRHFFGTQLVERGANLRDVQELMGHESIETTAIYLDVTARHLKSTVALLDMPVPLPAVRNTPSQP
jgi:integrase